MRFLSLIKGDENAGMPPQALFAAMDTLIAAQKKSGALIDTAGLTRSAQGTRVKSVGGKLKIVDGPFTEAKEVIGGYAILEASSKEEAIDLAKAFMALHTEHWPEWEGECEVRQIEEG